MKTDIITYQQTFIAPDRNIYTAYYNSNTQIVGITQNQFGKLIWTTRRLYHLQHRRSN